MKTNEEIAVEIVKEIIDRGGFENRLDAELTLTRILDTKIGEIKRALIEAGAGAERAQAVELLKGGRQVYERYFHKSAEREREIAALKHYHEHGQASVSQSLIVFEPFVCADEWFAKMTAMEYAILIVEKWRDSEHYKPGYVPLPF